MDINKKSYNEYLNYGVVPSPNTIFNNVFKLEPGYFGEFTFENNITSSPKKIPGFEDYVSDETFQVDKFNYLISDSINLREQADVEVANIRVLTHLILCKICMKEEDINTFSVVLEDDKSDENIQEVSKIPNKSHRN